MKPQYSCFISYRRNEGDRKFIQNLKNIIQTEAQRATNIKKVFFDEDSIKLGSKFDEKIYEGIVDSLFFVPIYHNSYLNKDDLWCAKELYRALKVQEEIQKILEGYCFILPLMDKSFIKLPNCIETKNAKLLQGSLRRNIENGNKTKTQAVSDFEEHLYGILLENYNLLEQNGEIIIKSLCTNIEIPSDEEVRAWVLEQRNLIKKEEGVCKPILTKNKE